MDDDMPRRRRGASAVAIEASEERNLAMRILLHSPKDLIAGALAFAAVSAIIANAMFMQAGHHPSPMFGTGRSAGGACQSVAAAAARRSHVAAGRCQARLKSGPRKCGPPK